MKQLLQIVAAAAVALTVTVAANADPAHVIGTIASASTDALVVGTADGKRENVRVDERTRVGIRTPADHAILDKNVYVGVTATPQADGSLLASEVHVFAESQRGVGEGHHPMNGPPGTTMTNATVKTVDSPSKSSMTNATVTGAAKSGGVRRLTLTYPQGTQTVVVPDDVPVVTTSNGDRSALVAGTHVIVNGERGADGGIAAARISVGAKGSVPPI
ncbi:MAG: DUF5666 domain-containing protein [Betaproteobacteria bacterium]